MKEKINKPWKIILIVVVSVFLVLSGMYFLFIFDIGLNSKYFVKRDFTKAFLARKTGDCYFFVQYIYSDKDKWYETCIKEKNQETAPIINFVIKDMTIRGNEAFLNVELQRQLDSALIIKLSQKLNKEELERLERYRVNYDLIKDNSNKFLYIFPKTKWIIKNEKK